MMKMQMSRAHQTIALKLIQFQVIAAAGAEGQVSLPVEQKWNC